MSENLYELAYMSRMGDDWSFMALFHQLEPLVKAEIHQLLNTARTLDVYEEDLMQEAQIVLPKALDSYRDDVKCGIATFLFLVMKRRIYTIVRHYFSKNHCHTHNALPFDDRIEEKSGIYTIGYHSSRQDPTILFQYREALKRFEQLQTTLNPLEKKIVGYWMSDMSYKDASKALGITQKAYDGRLQRIKKKVKAAIYESEVES